MDLIFDFASTYTESVKGQWVLWTHPESLVQLWFFEHIHMLFLVVSFWFFHVPLIKQVEIINLQIVFCLCPPK